MKKIKISSIFKSIKNKGKRYKIPLFQSTKNVNCNQPFLSIDSHTKLKDCAWYAFLTQTRLFLAKLKDCAWYGLLTKTYRGFKCKTFLFAKLKDCAWYILVSFSSKCKFQFQMRAVWSREVKRLCVVHSFNNDVSRKL